MATPRTRGINHVGIVVSDIEAATQFFVDALGAELLYQSFGTDDPPVEGDDLERLHGLAPGTKVFAQRVLKIETGPDIELFQATAPDQRGPASASDLGLTHIAFYVDDIDAAIERFEQAGGTVLSPPNEIRFETEAGEGNTYCYARTPWGMYIEFITLPGEMGYETRTPSRRWQREG